MYDVKANSFSELNKIIELNNSTTIVREWVVDYH